ncbi:D-alanyl-D-alanine carboxypeptidase [Hyphomicrobium sp.]|uniref:D-alanyl-D-alanine carboxypeptidase n=1 Tax=Hyphomicrobium sp. TaxID=82 RepID=UPI00356178CA
MLRRAFACASALLIVFGFAQTSANARGNRHAALILDANTGAILHNTDGDAPRHPASLTKMMTLYLTFETLQSGRLRMSDKITISEHAADAAPSKLDLDPGDQISVADAIKAIVTKSANDIAVALAERIGGSEPNFARLMNTRALAIGMTGTHYENASGLPNDDQITTARDMATLALHLQDDFPQYYPFFATRVFSYGGKSFRNHNTMLNSMAGIDGIKTGYTRASGFNLVTSLRRGDRHLVGVVFGGDTAGERNAEMRILLTRALSRASPNKTRKPLMLARLRSEPKIAQRPAKRQQAIAVAEATRVTPERPRVPEPPPAAAPEEDSETPVHIFKVRAVPISNKARRDAPSPDETTDMEGTDRAPDRSVSPTSVPPVRETVPALVRVGAASKPDRTPNAPIRAFAPTNLAGPRSGSAPRPEVHRVAAYEPPPPRPLPARRAERKKQNVASNEMHAPPVIRGMPPSTLGAQARTLGAASGQESFRPRDSVAQAASGRYAVQIGAYGSIDDAQRALTNVQDRAGRLLAGVSSVTNPTTKNGQQYFRARFTGFDANRATSTCNALRRQSVDCFVMAGE